MNELDRLIAELRDIDAKLDAIPHDATEAQLAEGDALLATRKKVSTAFGREKDRLARAEETSRLEADANDAQARAAAAAERAGRIAPGATRKTDRDQPGPTRVTVKEPDYSKDPKRGFRNHREFLNCVMEAGQNETRYNYRPDPRLVALEYNPARNAAAGSDEARGISDPTGGYLIPEDFHPDLLKVEPEADPMGGMTTKIPMARPIVRIPARTDKNHTTSVSGGLIVTRKPETVAKDSSQMTLEQVSLEANGLFGLSYASEELLYDSPMSFAAILAAGFSDQFTYQLINERLNGTGVGEYEGVINAPATLTVAKIAGQAAKTIVYENILGMVAQCWGFGKSIWIANHDTLPQLGLLNHQVGTAGTGMIWQPSAREDTPNLLMGRPVIFSEYAQTLGTPGDLILGNWSEYLEGTYQPMQSAESIHVRFVNHERTFKFWTRNAGRLWWKTALTPRNSSNQLSPFVILGTR